MNVKQVLFAISILAFFNNNLFSQKLNHVAGELIVQLTSSVDANTWLDDVGKKNELLARLSYNKIVSAPLNIHRYTFDEIVVDEIRMLEAVRNSDDIILAQFNHFIEWRSTIPDDPQFLDQWQYINTGQSGGTIGADIDADLAWDITTGGLTAAGDTIVVCVIDSGCQLSHPDLAENIWYNYAEIPNNGIDDDNNGYVDDYRGWSIGSQSDAVNIGAIDHGTSVAGIVGAKGNNGVGVAGVNWDVKIMNVQLGGLVESAVLEAYSYSLAARMKYNETDGAEGAFVVATNASWGIDFGQPDDAPIWCSFYDSLGVHGILNTGATINGNQNVDVIGDLPTACPSDYLISVTNMNRFDEKVTGAGYGFETIDLGAFGAETWTVESNSAYGPFGGTSGATPHVTGAIALMYAAPCDNFIALAKSNPGAAALQARYHILESGDDNISLQGITTTGKRLNVNNCLVELMNNCGPCPSPVGLRANNVTDITATLEWNTSVNTIVDTLRWKEEGTNDWNIVSPAASPYELTDLVACAFYEFQIISNCDSISSEPSIVSTFKMDGCCELPTEFSNSNISQESATISWNSVLAAQGYNFRYRALATTDWIEITGLTGTSVTIDQLNECTTYEYQTQVICQNEMIDFGGDNSFLTEGCGLCAELNYCEIEGLNSDIEWIESFSIESINNVSGNNEGYGNFAGQYTPTFEQFGTYEFTLTPGFINQASGLNIKIWIDLNGNGLFGGNERIFEASDVDGTITDNIEIPGTAITGLTRMRVALLSDNVNNPCSPGLTNSGEMEDYCVMILDGVSIKEVPSVFGSVQIFPSPFNQNLNLSFQTTDQKEELTITLLNELGQTILIQNLENSGLQTHEIQLQTNDIPEGLYLLRLQSGNSSEVFKVVKTK